VPRREDDARDRSGGVAAETLSRGAAFVVFKLGVGFPGDALESSAAQCHSGEYSAEVCTATLSMFCFFEIIFLIVSSILLY